MTSRSPAASSLARPSLVPTLPFDDLSEVTVVQGPIAQFMGIGTVVLRSVDRDLLIHLRGVREPEVIKSRLEARRP